MRLPPLRPYTSATTWGWRDLRPLLDEAVARLPEQYRSAVVLLLRGERLVLATDSIKYETNNRLCCSACSLVRLDSLPSGDKVRGATLIRANKLYLSVDGPVASMGDLQSRKITQIEPIGDVSISFRP